MLTSRHYPFHLNTTIYSKAIFHHGSPKQGNNNNDPSAPSTSSGHGHGHSASTSSSSRRSRDIAASTQSGAGGVTGSPNSKAAATQQHHAVHAAPSKAQAAPMAAYNPEPHRASEARGFVGHNPAQQPGQQHQAASGVAGYQAVGLAPGNTASQYATGGNNGNNIIPRGSPGLAAANAQNPTGEDTRAKAEKMVNAEREARGRLPIYEGLPEYFTLDQKMGE